MQHEFDHGTIYQGDCLELMKAIPDGSIDLICIDPPYNIGKAEWDKIDNYIDWMGLVFYECERVLKDNGSFYFFHNDFLQIVKLQNWLNQNSQFIFKQLIVWDKYNGTPTKHPFKGALWKQVNSSGKRNYSMAKEYCLFYVHSGGLKAGWDKTGLQRIYGTKNCFAMIKQYLDTELGKSGYTQQTIRTVLKNEMASHYFNFSTKAKTQFALPTLEQYTKLQTTGFFQRPHESLRQEYESLRQEYESLRYVFNQAESNLSVFTFPIPGKEERVNHPTQKSIALIEHLIKVSSSPGDTVLDCFIGSGTTGIAAYNTERCFIGMEKDADIYDMAVKRIDTETRQLQLFNNPTFNREQKPAMVI